MIVGISGRKQSGKDTVAKIWQLLDFAESSKYEEIVGDKYANKEEFVIACLEHKEDYAPYRHYFRWETHSFAHKLKQIVSILTGVCTDCLEYENIKQSPLPENWFNYPINVRTYRDLLQKLGTEVFREHVAQSIWIDLLIAEYQMIKETIGEPNWLITDVRFPDEADAIRKAGGYLIRVRSTMDIASKDTHPSETGLDSYREFRHTIINDLQGFKWLVRMVDNIRDIERTISLRRQSHD